MKTFALLIALLVSNAHAVLIAPTISGDENTLHAEFFFDFGPNDFGDSFSGNWAGGTFIFGGSIAVVFTINQLEMRQDFWIRTFWNDGWQPDALGNQRVGTNGFGPFPILLFTHHPPSTPVPDYGPNNLQYLLAGSAFLDLTLLPDRSGHGMITYDISRAPAEPLARNQSIGAHSNAVPDAGSTLLLFALSLHAVRLAATKML